MILFVYLFAFFFLVSVSINGHWPNLLLLIILWTFLGQLFKQGSKKGKKKQSESQPQIVIQAPRTPTTAKV